MLKNMQKIILFSACTGTVVHRSMGQDSIVGIATCCGLDGPGI
jgi:hypothetical protein